MRYKKVTKKKTGLMKPHQSCLKNLIFDLFDLDNVALDFKFLAENVSKKL
jgi:hypothetical protein